MINPQKKEIHINRESGNRIGPSNGENSSSLEYWPNPSGIVNKTSTETIATLQLSPVPQDVWGVLVHFPE